MNLEKYIIELGSVKTTKNRGTEFKVENGVLYVLGTDDTQDWLINLRAFRYGYHEGFLSEAQKIRYLIECKCILSKSH